MARSFNTRNAFRPQFESLGDRIVPAIVSITQNVATGLAVVTANGGNDSITLNDNGHGGLSVAGTGLGAAVQPLLAGITHVQINTGAGNDSVRYVVNGTKTKSLDLQVTLGLGNDRFVAVQNGFDITGGATEAIKVDGGAGADRITVAAGTANNPVNIGAGSSLQLQLSGGSSSLFFKDMADVIAVDYEGDLDGRLLLQGDGGSAGNDNLRATLTLDSGSTGVVAGFNGAKASLSGGAGSDALDFRVRDHSGGSAAVSAQADAGFLDFASDTIRHTPNVTALNVSGSEDLVVA